MTSSVIRWPAVLALAISSLVAQAQSSKQDLVAKVLQLQMPGIEGMARSLIEGPMQQMSQQVSNVIRQRVPADKREALAKEIQADMRKFLDETTPLLRSTAVKLAPTTIGTLLEEKMSEDELRDLIKILESPVNRKYQSLFGEMQRSIGEKLVFETRGTVQEKLKALEQTVGKRMQPYMPAGSAPKSN